jgi:hypothetical protein
MFLAAARCREGRFSLCAQPFTEGPLSALHLLFHVARTPAELTAWAVPAYYTIRQHRLTEYDISETLAAQA